MSNCQVQTAINMINWEVAAELPSSADSPHIGVAGPIAGVIDGKLIVAGGANFPKGMPWEGGIKHYQKDAYIYSLDDGKVILDRQVPFPDSLAYSANASANDYLYTIGGERNGSATADVFRYSFVKNSLHRDILPSLPLPLTNASAVFLKDRLYLVGGENSDIVSQNVYVLDLRDAEPSWELFFAMPNPLTHTMIVSDGRENIWIAEDVCEMQMTRATYTVMSIV